jgi:hypothetical protein
MTGLANLFFVSLLASGMASTLALPSAPLAFDATDLQAPSPQSTNQDSKPVSPRPNPDASGKYHVGDGVTTPKITYMVEPEFSDKLRKKKISASCVVGLTVDADGNPKDVHVVSSIPSLDDKRLHAVAIELQDSCIKPVKQYRFEPGLFQGKPVPVEINVEINFQIF